MADELVIQITGVEAVMAALNALPARIQQNVLRGAARAGAAVIRDEARLRAPVYTGKVSEGHPPPGTLKKNIYLTYVREQSTAAQQTYKVGVRSGKKLQGQVKYMKRRDGTTRAVVTNQDAYYWVFVEKGTSKMAAKPFMRPALDAKKADAIAAMQKYLADRVAKEVEAIKV